MARSRRSKGYLRDARVYLSGPMDFVASRREEKESGWRVRVGQFLRTFGATVFDPWSKPGVRGLHEYGREDVDTTRVREEWTFAPTPEGAGRRAKCSGRFWETMHIDLRMVDVSDFVVACCPTNIYSVGTVHEIVLARQQRKPVLLVSPPVAFPAHEELKTRLASSGDQVGDQLLDRLAQQVPIRANPRGIPSLWYMPLVGSENLFDGFGFGGYSEELGWGTSPSDERERQCPPQRPLLPFLEELNHKLPEKWDATQKRFVRNDDWLLLELEQEQ